MHLTHTSAYGDTRHAHYRYDALGRRISKSVRHANGTTATTHYGWDGDRLVHEAQDHQRTTVVYEPGTFVPMLRIDETTIDQATTRQIGAYHTDALGTPMQLVTPKGETLWQAQPDDWAAIKNERGTTAQPIRFQGQWHDEESGLYYNRHRYYDPQQGRYISQDPIGLKGGTNLYGYVTNPTGMVDPLGLEGVGQCGQGGLSLEGYMQERYGKLAITDDERLFAAAGDRQAFWDSRMERGDPIAPVAIGILNNETYVGYKFVGGRLANRFTGLKGEALNDLGVDLMRAHIDAVDFDFNEQIGIPGLLSPKQVAAYHHEVFRNHGLGAWRFGGTLANTSPNLMRSIWCTGCDHKGEAIR